ncbi:hypothetical protein H5410_030769, partial [Solanum commersonii]
YGTGDHPLRLNLISTHSLGHKSSGLRFATSLSGKPKTHEWLCICNYKTFRLNQNHYTSENSAARSFGEVSRCRRMTSATRYSSVCLIAVLCFPLAPSRFGPLGGIQTQVHSFKKGVSNSATQDSIMNIHNKIQITYANINYALKYSNCDTPLLDILMLAILATCASSSSTKSI